MADQRRRKEREAANRCRPAVDDALIETQSVLDEALGQLSEKYRNVLVFCELEGRSVKDVAAQLGVPQGTVASRLSRGRTLLGERLKARGIALSSAGLAALFTSGVAAGVPPPLLGPTVKAA